MSGLYIHIPYCRKACHYCNFHFSTILSSKDEMITCLAKEIDMRSDYLTKNKLETIYLGGGTPSILSESDLHRLLKEIKKHFDLSALQEFTIEANPDDISKEILESWTSLGIDRVSLGVQSFDEGDLKYMNRNHTAKQSEESIELIQSSQIESFSIDLIFGGHSTSDEIWENNLQKAIDFDIDHISAYGLTVEKNTALESFITKKKLSPLDDKKSSEQFQHTIKKLEAAGYEHYEISNYSKKNKRAIHNTNYWEGKKYLGIGPGAHSYDGNTRAWNISHNPQYIAAINNEQLILEKEALTREDKINEWIMISLRTSRGIHIPSIPQILETEKNYIYNIATKKVKLGQLLVEEETYHLSRAGKLLADQIISDFFIV